MLRKKHFISPDRHVIGSLELHDWLKKNQKLGQARINEVKTIREYWSQRFRTS